MKPYFSFLLVFAFLGLSSQEIKDKETFKKCRKEFNKKTCLADDDGDGILNYLDVCKDVAGPPENNGCPFPDTDGDGIFDKDDACPSVVGPSGNNGCPWQDTDGDGIIDKDDKCPTVAGNTESGGCNNYSYKCNEAINEAMEYWKKYPLIQEEMNYKQLQELIFEQLKKINFDAQILLFLNDRIIEEDMPRSCPNIDFIEEREFSTESYIWNKEMFDNLSKNVSKTIFPADYNKFYWNGSGYISANDNENAVYSFLSKKQKEYISTLPSYRVYKDYKIKYINVKKEKLLRLDKKLNQILMHQDARNEVTLQIITKKYVYLKKFIKSDNNKWTLFSDSFSKN